MEREEQRRADALDQYWDVRLRDSRQGGGKDVDRIAAAIIDQIANTPREPGTNAAQLRVRQRIVAAAGAMEESMNTAILLDAVSGDPTASLNPPRDFRSELVPRITVAALLLLTLGLGYAWKGPRPSENTPNLIPAAVLATEESTPGETSSPNPVNQWNGHPVVGTWQLDNEPSAPGTNLSVAVFDPLGRYQEIESDGRIIVGSWQATADDEVEVVFVIQSIARQDLLAADHTPVANEFIPGMEVWRLTITVDESGNTLSATGTFESYAANGTLEFQSNYQGTGVRMAAVPTDAAASLNP